MLKMRLPFFENEAAEAQWWYDHREEVSDRLLTALREGRTSEGSVARYARKLREAEEVEAAASGVPIAQAEDVLQPSFK